MISLIKLALTIQDSLDNLNLPYCFIGGVALQRWGEFRTTVDVDLTIFTGFSGDEKIINKLSEKFEPRIADYKDLALVSRVLLLKQDNIGIDISLAGLPFEEQMIQNASFFEYLPEMSLKTCSAEDLIIMKAFADRGKDWVDIEGVLIRQGIKNLRLKHIFKWLEELQELKYDDSILPKLEKLIALVNKKTSILPPN